MKHPDSTTAARGSYERRTVPHVVPPVSEEEFFRRVEFERFVLGMEQDETCPAQVGAGPPPPSESEQFSSWLRAAKFWRDLRRRYGNGSSI
jgi:hypothetical protein